MLQKDYYSSSDLDSMFNVIDPPGMQLPSAPMRMIDRIIDAPKNDSINPNSNIALFG